MMFVLLFIQLLRCLNDVSCWSIGLMRVDEKEPWLVGKKSVLMMVESKDEKTADSSDKNWAVLSEEWKIAMKVGRTVWKGNPECYEPGSRRGCADGSLLGRL
jgi:hypothetical protein